MFPTNLRSSTTENIDHGGRFFTPTSTSTSSNESRSSPSRSNTFGSGNSSNVNNGNGNIGGNITNHGNKENSSNLMWDNFWPRTNVADVSSSGSSDNSGRGSSDWPYREWTNQVNTSSTPIPMDNRDDGSRNNQRSSFSFPGDSKLLDLCGSYGSLLSASLNRNCDNFGQVPPRSGIRAIRAPNSNNSTNNSNSLNSNSSRLFSAGEPTTSFESSFSNRLNNSGSSGRDSRESPNSPINSDSGLALGSLVSDEYVTQLMSQLNLASSINEVCRAQVKASTRMPNAAASMFSLPHPTSLVMPAYPPGLSRTASFPDPFMLTSLSGDKRWMYAKFGSHRDYLDKAIELQRTAASYSEATLKWSGNISSTDVKNPSYSTKVFLGGTPYDLTDEELIQFFSTFGRVEVEWPKENSKTKQKKKGYNYMIFESEKCVKALLSRCEVRRGKYYIKLPSRRMPDKDVQVIPWALCNSNYTKDSNFRVEFNKTVFVGNLHGMMTAEALAKIMDELFGNVIYAGIDVDRHRYPIGSARIAFSDTRSHKKAVEAAFIDVEMGRVTKRVSITNKKTTPYLKSIINFFLPF